MTPKEKADELCSKYYNRLEHILSIEYVGFDRDIAKQCALVAVDEILSVITNSNDYYIMSNYYQQVKQEMEKL